MKEKTADIDILEEKEKEAIKDLEEYLHWEELQGFSMLPRDKHIETLLNLVSNLIAENKELKEENEGLKTKLDTLIEKYKELKEEKETDYTSVYLKGVYDERDEWQKKIKEMIEELKETADEDNMEDFVRIEILQYLLRKE